MSSYTAYSSEQIDPFDTADANLWRRAEYLGRYLFACDFLRPHNPEMVADVACGLGYGAAELCGVAARVLAVDGSLSQIQSAGRRFDLPNLQFLCKDIDEDGLSPEIEEESLDALVSFETLEHLLNPGRAAEGFSRALKPGGHFICSVPNVLYESGDSSGLPRNRSHKQWYNYGSLCRLAQQNGMRVLYRLGQSWSKALFRREQQLFNAKRISLRLGSDPAMQRPEMIRWLSYVAAYPSVEDVDGSYSIIIVAQKN